MGTHLRQRVLLKDLNRKLTIADMLADHAARKRWRKRLAEPVPPDPALVRKSRKGARSRYRGVQWSAARGLWRAVARWDGQAHYLGMFATEDAAARAVDARMIEVYGRAAITNFAREGQGTC